MMTIIRHTGLALALFLGACGAEAQDIGGERYRIPPENLLMNTFAGQFVRDVYRMPETDGELGLVFTGEEVAEAIPGFHSRTQGYIGLVDASPSAGVRRAGPFSNFGEALQANVERLEDGHELVPYPDSTYFWNPDSKGLFDLVSEDGGWHRDDLIPPGCTMAQAEDGKAYHSCLFRLRRDGFEYSFWLSGENVNFADKYADFVRTKLESWRVSPDD